MAQGLAAKTPLSNSVKRRDMRPTSRSITALSAAVVTGFAVSAMIGAPIAVAEVCQPGHVGIDGRCTFSDNNATTTSPAPPDRTGTLMCNQAGHCTIFRAADPDCDGPRRPWALTR